jgi:hypothetical protein
LSTFLRLCLVATLCLVLGISINPSRE